VFSWNRFFSFSIPIVLAAGILTLAPAVPAAETTGAPAAVVPAADQYIIGPGDSLRIVVLRNPELNADVVVRPDGKISTPLVNDITAVGKTPTQLTVDLRDALGEFIRDPSVSINVLQATSRFSQVKVVGQAIAPKAVPYRNGMTVLDLVIEVGGLSQFAAANRAKIVREQGGKTKEIKVKLGDLMNKGKVSQNLALMPGDILVIPESLF